MATTIERRLRALEAAQVSKTDLPRSSGSPEECCASYGYTLDQAVAEFGSYPAFCYAMMTRPAPAHIPPVGNPMDVYRAMCK